MADLARLLFLGRLEDAAGGPELAVALAAPTELHVLIARLPAELSNALGGPKVRVALNGELVSHTDALIVTNGDEIAFLPPVSGG